MDLRQRRPSYDYKSSFWPLAGIMVMMIIMVCARNYNFNLWREITIIVASISEIDRLWT
jgi:hypothetical protein